MLKTHKFSFSTESASGNFANFIFYMFLAWVILLIREGKSLILQKIKY